MLHATHGKDAGVYILCGRVASSKCVANRWETVFKRQPTPLAEMGATVPHLLALRTTGLG